MNSGFYFLDCLTEFSSGKCLDIILTYACILVTSNLFVFFLRFSAILTHLSTYHVRRFLPYDTQYLWAFLDPPDTLKLSIDVLRFLANLTCIYHVL